MGLINTESAAEIRCRGPLEQFLTSGITLLTGQNLAMGTVLGKVTASGKYVAYDDDGTDDGRRVAVGILMEDMDATDEDKVTGMFTRGNFYYDRLTGADAAAVTDLNGRLVGNELQI